MRFTLFSICNTVLIGLLSVNPSFAEETLSVVGSWSGLPLHKQYEQPFWTQTLPAEGEYSTTLTTHDQMGIQGSDVFRMLSDGIFDVGITVADYAVSDIPALEGLDVPLIATDADAIHQITDAARPMVEEIYQNIFNAKVLAIVPYPPQVVFCNTPIQSIDDLSGLKIRASGRMTAKFLEALGAESTNVSFGEVPGALQRGVIDCAITGSGSGYSAGWWEVTTHLMTLPLGGWDPVVTAINLDKWNSLSASEQSALQKAVAEEFEQAVWQTAQRDFADDTACLTGNGECSQGETRDLVLVAPSTADIEHAKQILTSTVLPEWAERAGTDWAKKWNDSVGQLVDLEIPLS